MPPPSTNELLNLPEHIAPFPEIDPLAPSPRNSPQYGHYHL